MFKKLQEIRKSQGRTCEQMAQELGCTKGTYNKKERGQITMTLADAKKISRILDKSIDYIFFEN